MHKAAADTYKAKCMMCHGADGLGATPVGKSLNIVSFKDPSVVKSSNAELAAIIKNGKNKMAANKTTLSNAQIGALVEYIRTLEKRTAEEFRTSSDDAALPLWAGSWTSYPRTCR